MAAGRGFNARPSSTVDGSANALPQAGLDDRGMVGGGDEAGGVRAPDISSLSPEERADRLYNRVMLLASEGKIDSVQFFAPMAVQSYLLLQPLNLDQRYDLGRIGEVTGALPLAQAQADTILRENPNHLLGLILEARLATIAGDSARVRSYERRLLAASPESSTNTFATRKTSPARFNRRAKARAQNHDFTQHYSPRSQPRFRRRVHVLRARRRSDQYRRHQLRP